MAFVRRKGNAYYLVHNVRRGGKVKQLHLARLGERAKITDTIVREVSKKHPFVDLNWRALRDQLNQRIDLADPDSPEVLNLINPESIAPRPCGPVSARSPNFRITRSGQRVARTVAALAVHNPGQIGSIRAWKRAFGSGVAAASRR